MNKYQLLQQIDNGSYSVVYKAIDTAKCQIVAIKKMKEKLVDAQKLQLRQLKILQNIKNPCIINLIQWFVEQDGHMYLVFEFMQQNLLNLYVRLSRKRNHSFSEKEIKYIIFQVTLALFQLHNNNIIHRDIKPQNILVSKHVQKIKLTDFGLSKYQEYNNTEYVSTRWYRAPQILLGIQKYSTKVDIFALGCIMGQLYNSKQLFPGNNTLNQLNKIFFYLGTPTQQQWQQGYGLIIQKIDLPFFKKQPFESFIKNLSLEGNDLLSKMLRINPTTRISARQILEHKYFDDILVYLPEPVLLYSEQSKNLLSSTFNDNKYSYIDDHNTVSTKKFSQLKEQVRKKSINKEKSHFKYSRNLKDYNRFINPDYISLEKNFKSINFIRPNIPLIKVDISKDRSMEKRYEYVAREQYKKDYNNIKISYIKQPFKERNVVYDSFSPSRLHKKSLSKTKKKISFLDFQRRNKFNLIRLQL